ncbi:MAG: hypothetical protein QOF78_3135 [Phycisphaerales bacterium]|jgi:probable phosphoglycerate mutase|nr:hypothetical protein [Phycisphaerales bacterium]
MDHAAEAARTRETMMNSRMVPRIHLIRHGETEWSLSGRHTSGTDIPLTERGERQAHQLGERLRHIELSQVWTSPLQRARRTCELAGFASVMKVEPAITEWNYGDYEGLTSAEIRARHPHWNLFQHGCPGGESPADVSDRVDQILPRLRAAEGNAAVFSHGHFLRALAARWLALTVREGQRLLLHTASLSILSGEHDSRDEPVIVLWNSGPDQSHAKQ